MDRRQRKKKGLFRKRELISLGILLISVLTLFAVTGSFSVLYVMFFKERNQSVFQQGQEIQISSTADKTSKGQDLAHYHNWVGNIKKIHSKEDDEKNVTYTYQVTFKDGSNLEGVSEESLVEVADPNYDKGDLVQIANEAGSDLDGENLAAYKGQAATINNVAPNYSNEEGGYKYDVTLDSGETLSNVPESALGDVYWVPLDSANTAAENNEILREAFAYAAETPGTVLSLPSGEFLIGSDTPQQDYITLSSDTVLRGSNTRLKVQGTAYWFGFATGTGAADGVRNFTMSGIEFRADNLETGAHFMIMADHGDNWNINNNTFTMVHKKSSHIFDLGGLQNSVFDSNRFIGYAPELTSVTGIPSEADAHDYYAEAIQFDAADNKGTWDGGLIQNLDPNYSSFNQIKHLCDNITVTNNSFLPYTDETGNLVAYGATIGQHSSDTGLIVVAYNTFTSSIVNRYKESQTDRNFNPIHFSDNSNEAVSNNVIN
ncbi:HlyD family secretion protein [Streptococcus chenjunshii]|uniref:HlyD family secretion protein n=1 Tax=Streptococcus chenjunshii TaxID=2173853 RepID=A0A372KP09_9STRE|nr:HlyD family secretion protein [Streptococcus chenjunshii]AXQ78707.1 HlyD family secretion protein [Streptococcus chenjunshii]RFU51700.1 HlyD family secretion protein [Streptococcus chenjunshii]RFU54021.1 HlyD family secretion protein [Streptococcus chenjunshii]